MLLYCVISSLSWVFVLNRSYVAVYVVSPAVFRHHTNQTSELFLCFVFLLIQHAAMLSSQSTTISRQVLPDICKKQVRSLLITSWFLQLLRRRVHRPHQCGIIQSGKWTKDMGCRTQEKEHITS